MTKSVLFIALVLILGLIALAAAAQSPTQFGADDLKRMLGERDIVIEQQGRIIQTLEKENAALKQENTDLKKAIEKGQ
jgi:hypothetical protein